MQTSKWSLKGAMTSTLLKRQVLIVRVILYRKNFPKKVLNPSEKEILRAVKDQGKVPKKIYLTPGSQKEKYLERTRRSQV